MWPYLGCELHVWGPHPLLEQALVRAQDQPSLLEEYVGLNAPTIMQSPSSRLAHNLQREHGPSSRAALS